MAKTWVCSGAQFCEVVAVTDEQIEALMDVIKDLARSMARDESDSNPDYAGMEQHWAEERSRAKLKAFFQDDV